MECTFINDKVPFNNSFNIKLDEQLHAFVCTPNFLASMTITKQFTGRQSSAPLLDAVGGKSLTRS
jgi:hypothetical protein